MDDKLMIEQYMDVGQKLAGKWDWLVEDIQDDFTRGTTAILLENTARKIVEDSGSLMNEGFETGDVQGINRIMLPIIRRVYPHLMANEFVTVQPMLTPTAQIFYMRYRMGASATNISSGNAGKGRKGTTKANDEFLRVPALGTFGVNPYYSSQVVWNEAFTSTNSGMDNSNDEVIFEAGEALNKYNGGVFTKTIDWTPALKDTVKVKLVEVTEQAVPVIAGVAAHTEYLYGDVVQTIVLTNDAGDTPSGAYASGATAQGIKTATLVAGTLTAVLGTDTVPSGKLYALVADYEYNLENNAKIPEMKISIDTDYVYAKERKLKTEFTQEALQDLKALHNIDAEAEITAVISSMLIAEIDREILNDLMVGAAIRLTHDYNNVGGFTGSTNFLDRNQALAAKVIDAAAQIHAYGKLGSGNWCVCNPTVAARLEAVRGYEGANSGKYEEYALGINFVGTLQGRSIKVYSDPYFPKNKILVGYKGNSFLSTSYVYAPYQPLYSTPTIYDPATLKPIKGFLTRYGKKLVSGGEYLLAVVDITNFA